MAATKMDGMREKIVSECLAQCCGQKAASGVESVATMAAGIWEAILAAALPLLLDAFQKCLGNKAKKAAMIDEEQRRLSVARRTNRAEKRAHKFTEKVFNQKAVVDANGGNALTEDQKNEIYDQAVQYAFENRDTVAGIAAKK